MNKVYKLIWSKVKNCWVVTSEMAKGHGKSTSGRAKGRVLAASVLTVLLGSALFPMDAVYAADPAADGKTHYVSVDVNTDKKIEARGAQGEVLVESAVDPTVNYEPSANPAINAISIGAEAGAWNNGAIATGFKTTARGEYSTALGTGSGAYSKGDLALGWKAYTGWNEPNKIAIGTESTAVKENGISIGTKSKTWDKNAIAIGNEAETGNEVGRASHDSIAIGNKAKIQGQHNVAIGSGVTVGVGEKDSASSYVVAIGSDSHAYDTDSIVIGGNSEVRENATVIGNRSKAGMQSVALGSDVRAGEWSIAIGLSSKAHNHSIAMGMDSEASAADSVAFGNNATAKGLGAIAIGSKNDVTNGGAQAYSEDAIVIGRGAQAGNKDDTEIAYNTVAIGANAKAVRVYTGKKINDAVLIGANTQVTRERGIAVGANAYVDGASGAAFGDYASVIADEGLAIGKKAKIAYNSAQSIAIGSGAEVKNENAKPSERAVAIGTGVVVGGNSSDSIAIGTGAKTQGVIGAQRSIVIGKGAVVKNDDSVAIGTNASTDWNNAVAIGNGAQATSNDGIALGSGSKATVYPGNKGYDPYIGRSTIDANPGAAWLATKSALSVGDVGNNITRQITSVAAGSNDTDAVNVAQLKKMRTYTDTKMNAWVLKATSDKGAAAEGKKINNTDNAVTFDVENATQGLKVTRDGATIKYGVDDIKLASYITPRVIESINKNGIPITNISTKFSISGADAATKKNLTLSKTSTPNIQFLGTDDETTVTIDGDAINPTVTVGLDSKFTQRVTTNETNIKANTDSITALTGRVDTAETNITELQKGWTLAVARGDDSATDNEATVEGTSKKIGAGDKVTLKAGRGVKLKQDGTNVQIGLKFIDMDPAGWPFNDAKATGGGSLAVGQNSVAKGHQATAVGFDTKADQYGVALGAASEAGKSAVAIGNTALASGDGSIAIGTSKQKVEGYPDKGLRKVDSEDAIAIGTETAVDGSSKNATAVGPYADIANSNFSTALGNSAKVKDAAYGTALGNFSRVENAAFGTALGNNAAVIDAQGGVAIGAHSVANRNGFMPGYNPTGEQWSNFSDYLEKTGQKDAYDQATAKLEAAKQALAADEDNPELRAKVGQAIAEQNKIVNVWAGTQGAVSIGNEQMGFTRQLTGVAAGTQDTDAVNVAQLKALNTQVTTNEGNITDLKKGFIVKDAGTGSADVTLGGDDKQSVTFKAAVDKTTEATTGGSSLTSTVDADRNVTYSLNMKQLKQDLGITDGPDGVMSSWKLKATSGDTTEQAIKNGQTVTFDATGEGLTATRNGMTITYGIDGSKIDITGNKSITDLQTEIKDSKTTVEAGDYVTVTSSKKPGVDGTVYTVTGPKLTVVDGEKNLTVTDDTDEDGKKVGYKLELNKELTGLTSVSSDTFKAGNDVTLDKTGLTITGGPSVTTTGIDAGKKKITNVAAGIEKTDAVNVEQLQNVENKVNTNTTNIAANKAAIEKNAGDIAANKTAIEKNAGDIAANKTAIEKNAGDIAANKTAIEKNAGDIAANKTAIEKNAGDIAANKTAIEKNTGDIAANKTAIEKNAGDIAENKAEISKKMTSWNLKAEGDADSEKISNNGTVTFGVAEEDKGLTVERKGSTIKYGINGKAIDISENATVKKLETDIENSKATVKAGDENISVKKADGKNEYTITLAEDLKGLKSISTKTVNASEKVTVGDKVTINNEGLTVKDGPSVTTKGIDAGNKTITNVADGKADTDAVNVRQLNAIANRSDQNIAILGGKVSELNGRVNRVGAGAAALAALHPLDFDPDDKWDFAAGYGNYSGANAVAIGAYYRPNEDTMFSVGGSFGGGENMVNAGVSVKLGQGNNVTTSKIAMAKEIKDLRAEVEVLRQAIVGVGQGQELDPMKMKLFPDIEKNHWAYEAVEELAKQGLLEGYPDGTFGGDRMMTRYEFAEVVYRAMQKGLKVNEKLIQEFEPELERFRIDVISQDKDGNPVIERVRVNQQKAN